MGVCVRRAGRVTSAIGAIVLALQVAGCVQDEAAAQGPAVLAAKFPSTDDGKPLMQLGIYPWWYANQEGPFLDLARLGDEGGWKDRRGKSFADLWAEGFIDKATGHPKAIPSGGFLEGRHFREGSIANPAYYAGTYVVEWTGDADIAVHPLGVECATPTQEDCLVTAPADASGGRIEARFAPTRRELSWINIWRLGPGGLKSLKIYRKENEARVKAGEIFDPAWIAHARRYKILRFMDVQDASRARPFHAGDFMGPAYQGYPNLNYAFDARMQDAPKQWPFELLFRASVATDTAAWVHVAGLPGATAKLSDATGDVYAAWKSAGQNDFRAILVSPDWAAYMDGIVRGLIASNYPADRMVYLEPWNEVWNYGPPWGVMTAFCDGLSNGLGSNPAAIIPWRYGYGYMTAHVMVAFDAALKRAGRKQAWTIAMGTHLALDEQAKAGFKGFKAYFAERGGDPAPWLRHVGLAVGSYYSEAFAIEPHGFMPAATPAEHRAKWRAAIDADPAGLAKRRADWTISDPQKRMGTIPWIVLTRTMNQKAAEEAGAYFLGDYEGEAHDVMPDHLKADPKIVNWAEAFTVGAEGERVTKAWVDAMKKQNPKAVIANYLSIGTLDPEGNSPTDAAIANPWFDGFHGEANGRTRGLSGALRR